MKGDKIIEIINVTKSFSPNDNPAVDNITLDIREGEFVTLLGPSGCGKTTTLRMIAGFEMPTSGQILLNGKDITSIPPHLRPVNTVFQRYALFPHLNVYNNIAFGLKLKRIPTEVTDKNGKTTIKQMPLSKEAIKEKVRNILKMVDLADYEARNVDSLSGGQQQRVAIARALVNQPKVLLLDEPLGALDLKMRQDMQLELKEMHSKLGITFVYVTHDQEEALTMSNKIVVMKDGTIQQIGTPMEVYNEPKNAFVANFIGESNIISGVMVADYTIKFGGKEFACVDKGFRKNEAVDIVIRPEDMILSDSEGMLEGEVLSNTFKGVYFEMQILCGNLELLVHNTKNWAVGDKVYVNVKPSDIHIMRKLVTANYFDATIKNNTTITFAETNWECDLTALYPNLTLNQDEDFVNADGEVVNLVDTELTATISLDGITLTDNEEDGMVGGEIIYKIFKADHYNYIVHTDDGYSFTLNSTDNWDDNDRVGININPANIKLSIGFSEDNQ